MDVKLHCIYIEDIDNFTKDKNNNEDKNNLSIDYNIGNGIVNVDAIKNICTYWRDTKKQHVELHPLNIKGINHMDMLKNKIFLDHLYKLLIKDEDN